jgi:cytochrome c peroxidase
MRYACLTGVFALAAMPLPAAYAEAVETGQPAAWSARERRIIESMRLPVAETASVSVPSNRFAADRQAAELGRKLFFDKRLSANGQIACSTCHRPELHYTDGFSIRHDDLLGGDYNGRYRAEVRVYSWHCLLMIARLVAEDERVARAEGAASANGEETKGGENV